MTKNLSKKIPKLIHEQGSSNLIEVKRKKGKTTYTVKTSKKDALKGAVTGAAIGARFAGPAGASIGAGIGGTIGFVFGDPD